MRKYEISYIIAPNLTEEDRDTVINELNDVFTSHDSEVLNVRKWGMRDLAYEIKDFKKGFYVILSVNSTEEARKEFDRILHIREDILRYLIIRDPR
jgi:small subunit ribosomal protein S6